MYNMIYENMYGVVYVPQEIFNKLNKEYFISHSDKYVKYMCANEQETKHLKCLGINPILCDWYKIILKEYL